MDRKAVMRETMAIMKQGYYEWEEGRHFESVFYTVLDRFGKQDCIVAFEKEFGLI